MFEATPPSTFKITTNWLTRPDSLGLLAYSGPAGITSATPDQTLHHPCGVEHRTEDLPHSETITLSTSSLVDESRTLLYVGPLDRSESLLCLPSQPADSLCSAGQSPLPWTHSFLMAAPSRAYNTFQVLARHRYRRQNTTEDSESKKERENASGRKESGQDGRERIGEVTVPVESRVTLSLDSFKPPTISTRTIQSLALPSIAGSGQPSRDTLPSESIGLLPIPTSTSIPSQSQPEATNLAVSLSEFSSKASSPRATVTVEANTIRNGTFTVPTAATSSPVPLASSGAKIDSEVLPGLNREPPRLGEQPKASPLAGPNDAAAAPLPQAITVNRPMPGKNQPIPIMDEAAASSFMVLNALPVPTSEASSTAEAVQPQSESTSSTIVSSVEVSTSSITLPSSIISTTTSPIPSSTTFTTVTTSSQLIEQGLVTLESTSAAQSVTAAQLFSAIASVTITTSALASSTASPQATSISADAQQQSRLSPLARTLFIIFGVLGKHGLKSIPTSC